MISNYNSTPETLKHIEQVAELLCEVAERIFERVGGHDASKLESPEKEIFDIYTPKLKDTIYGSDEYKQYLKEMDVALNHHYSENRHHPEHFENGIKDMNLIDIIEMFCDWKAATMRHADGDILKSIEINQKRFGYPNELKAIFLNSVDLFSLERDKKIHQRQFVEEAMMVAALNINREPDVESMKLLNKVMEDLI